MHYVKPAAPIRGRPDEHRPQPRPCEPGRAPRRRRGGVAGRVVASRRCARRSAAIGLDEREAKMRASQLWNWIYVNGVTDFERMSNIQKGVPADAGRQFPARPARDRHRADLGRRHPQMAVPLSRPEEPEPAAGRDRDRLHPRIRSRHAVRLLAGRLHAHLLVLPHRHADAGAQPHRRRNPRPDPDGARAAGRFPRRRAARRWRARSGAARFGRQRRRQPRHHQCGDDGHGRAALQLRQRQERAADRLGRRRHLAVASAASRCRPRASCRSSSRPAARSASCWRFRCTRCATICATCWCRSTRSSRSRS